MDQLLLNGRTGPVLQIAVLLLALAVGIGISRLNERYRKRVLLSATLVAALAGAALWWVATHEVPAKCAHEISDLRTLAYLRPQLQSLGYSSTDASTFQIDSYAYQPVVDWPTYVFYFSGTKDGETKWISAVGNGCGIGDLEGMGAPLVITEVD